MRWVGLPLGLAILAWTALDVIRTLVMPRAARGRFRLTRGLFYVVWVPWKRVALTRDSSRSRERILAMAAPIYFFVLLVGWVVLTLVGYSLLFWSPPFSGNGSISFVRALFDSGASLSTLGAGVTGSARVLEVAGAITGLGLFAVVIAYLPVLYQAFNRREVGVLLLGARAGSPPSGSELLHRIGSAGAGSLLPELFVEWERWVADVLESHMSYPLLVLFRSPHDDTSWVTSLGAVLDAATLILTSVDGVAHQRAKLVYGTGVHAIEDLFYYLRLEEREAVISEDEFRDVLETMRDDGYETRPFEEAFARFTQLRAAYAPRLDAISNLLAAPPGLWIGDRSYLGARTAHSAPGRSSRQ
jgi:hypothetical protein